MSISWARPLVVLPWASNYWGPNTSFIFLVASVPLIIVPKRRSQRSVVGSKAVTTLIFCSKLRDILSPHTCIFTIIIESLDLSSHFTFVPRAPLYKYIISCITHRFRRPFVPLYLRPVVPSSRCTFVPSYLRPVVPSSRRTFVPSYLRPVVPSSRRTFVPLYLRPVVPSSRRTFVPLYLRSVVPSSRRTFVPSYLRPVVPSSYPPNYLLTLIYHNTNMLVSKMPT